MKSRGAASLAVFSVLFFSQISSPALGADCSAVNLSTCDLNNELCQDCLLGLNPVDASKLTSVELKCPNDQGLFGRLSCNELNRRVTESIRKKLGVAATSYYKGKMLNWNSGTTRDRPVPVCNLADNENDRNFLGDSCGDLCTFEVHTSVNWDLSVDVDVPLKPGSCSRERAWMRGAVVQAENHHKENVFSELRGRRLQLVDYDGVRACAEAARDVVRGFAAIEKSEALILKNMGADAGKASQVRCNDANAQGTDAAKLHAVCQQEAANASLIYYLENLVYCEITSRSRKDFLNPNDRPADWLAEMKQRIQPICTSEVRGLGKFASDSSRTNRANSCYRREINTRLRDKLNNRWRVNGPMEKDRSGTQSSRNAAPVHDLPFFLMASLGLAGSRRRRSRFERSAKTLACVLGFSALFWGCSEPYGEDTSCNYKVAAEKHGATGESKGLAIPPDMKEKIGDANGGAAPDALFDGDGGKKFCGCRYGAEQAQKMSWGWHCPGDQEPDQSDCPPGATSCDNGPVKDPDPNNNMPPPPASPTTPAATVAREVGGPTLAANRGNPASQPVSSEAKDGGAMLNKPKDYVAPESNNLAPVARKNDAPPMVGGGGGTNSGGGFGGHSGLSAGTDDTGSAVENAALAAVGAANTKFEGTGGGPGGGGGSKQGSPFGAMGADGGGFGGAEGVTGTNYGNSAPSGSTDGDVENGGATDMESYLARVGNASLFEVVNKRYYRWGTDLDAELARKSFKH